MPAPILFRLLALDELDLNTRQKIDAIDKVLPQTQCGLCGYAEGCLPYAHAIVTKDEAINLCIPGGDATCAKIADIMQTPATSAKTSKHPIHPSTNRPTKMLAVIDEDACIGCTKCIAPCPVDAIVGTGKHMHSIIPDLCTGCELCVAPCPVDCIDIIVHNDQTLKQDIYRLQYYNHLERLSLELLHTNKPITSHIQAKINNYLQHKHSDTNPTNTNHSRNKTLQRAKLRSQIGRLKIKQKQQYDHARQDTIKNLTQQLDALDAS